MTTNLFVIANVKQLQTGGSFRILLPFCRTSWGVGVLIAAIFSSSHNRVGFGTILEGLPNIGEGIEPPPNPPPSVRHCKKKRGLFFETSVSVAVYFRPSPFWHVTRSRFVVRTTYRTSLLSTSS